MELVALSKLYSRSIIVYNEQGNGVQEQVFACVKDEGVESADDITNPVRNGCVRACVCVRNGCVRACVRV